MLLDSFCKLQNSHFERESHSFASRPSPSVCFRSPDGGDGAGEPTPHSSPRFTPAVTPLSRSGATETLQPPNHPARCSSTSPARSWEPGAIWDQFANRKRLNLSNKRYQLSPATCSQTLNRSGEGSASFLSGYFHFSSFQGCLAARLPGGSAQA